MTDYNHVRSREIAAVLSEKCLYLWTDREPPTTLNLTNWMYMLDDRQQDRIVEQLAARPRVCVVVNSALIRFWMEGRPLPQGPLIRYIDANFIPATDTHGMTILVRKGSKESVTHP